MDFEEFKEKFTKDIKKIMDERLGGDTLVQGHAIDKTNYSYDALTVKPENSELGVNLDMTALYKDMQQGVSYDEIVNGASDLAYRSLTNNPDFDIDALKDYDKMKGKLVTEVVSKEKNAELLNTIPHKDMEDMAVVYRFVLGQFPVGNGTILVTNKMLEQYGVSPEQLHQDAIKNAPEIRPMKIEGLGEILAQQMGYEQAEMLGLVVPPEQEKMFVASVEGNVHGAGVLAYQDFMDKAAERVGGSFYLIPSSLHELIILPDNGMMPLEEMKKMVKEVNETVVDPTDQLTDNVYHYDVNTKVFEIGEKFLQRQNEVEKGAVEAAVEKAEEKEAASEEKKSLLAQLRADKADIAKEPRKDPMEKGAKHKDDRAL